MTTPSQLWNSLQLTFEQDINITGQLLDLLERERTALEERQYDSFQQIIADKQPLLSQLEQHAAERQQLLHKSGFSDESSTLAAAKSQAPAVAQAWQTLEQQWQRCQSLNEVNERIVQRTKLVVSQMLDLLRGQNGNNTVYNAAGNTQNAATGNSITSA